MTRTLTESVGLRRNVTKTARNLYRDGLSGTATSNTEAMEGSIMTTADALATGAEMVVVEDVSASIEHHHHHHPHHGMMNGITVTLANGGTVTVGTGGEEQDGDSNNKYDVADKDEHDLGAIDFASAAAAANHNNMDAQQTPAGGDKMQCYGANPDEDNATGATMMIVDSVVGATETASNSSSSSSSSGSSSSSSDSSSSLSHRPQEETATVGQHEVEEEDAEEEEEEDDDGEEEEEEEDHPAQPGELEHNVDVKINVEKLQLQMMQTDDPILQETIKAILTGAAGIEVVNTTDHIEPVAANVVPTDQTIGNVMATPGRPANEETETDRNYECTYCGKLFTRSNTLSYHLKVHTGERPFKCKHCAKAFREQYRLMKHLKTHSKYRNRRLEQQQQQHQQGERTMVTPAGVRVHLQRGGNGGPTVTAMMAGTNGMVAAGTPEEDYTTGDSERFFKSYDLPDGAVAMKLEPDISLTEEAEDASQDVGPATMLATEEVETAEEHQEMVEVRQEQDPNALHEDVAPGEGSEIRYQIMEERIKSLQREVHMVNQNLSRVESKVDGLTRIISLFIGKFEDETELANQAAQLQQQHQQHHQEQQQQQEQEQELEQEPEQEQEQELEQEQDHEQDLTTVTVEEGEADVATLTMMSTEQQHASSSASASPSIQPKTIFLTSTSTPNVSTTQVQVFQTSPSPSITPQRSGKEATARTHFYQFGDPSATIKNSPRVSSPALTPPPPQQPQQHLTLAGNGGGNQLLDTFPDIPELPIRTVSDFLDLNDHCTDNEQFLLQMMIRLHQEIHNSQPFQRNIKRMMEALVTYEVLCQFSWSGKSAINGQYTKYVFGNSLGIIDLLTKTLNLGKSAEEAEANQKPIFAAIQSFIKHSRQNMIRDSRKRRDPMRNSMPTVSPIAGIAYLVNGERLQIKQRKSDPQQHHHHPHHQQQQAELVHQF